MELLSFIFLLYLGVRFIVARHIPTPTRMQLSIEQRLHPHSAFMIGFIRTLGNPGVLLGWVILAGTFLSRDWVEPTWSSKGSCIAGVACGTGLWFVSLSWFSARRYSRLNETSLLKMEHVSGFLLLGLASAHGIYIIWQLYKARGGH